MEGLPFFVVRRCVQRESKLNSVLRSQPLKLQPHVRGPLCGNMVFFNRRRPLFPVLTVSDGPPSTSDQQNEMAPYKLEATVPSRLALGARCGYSQRCWGSPVRQKKKHTGTHYYTLLVTYSDSVCDSVSGFYVWCFRSSSFYLTMHHTEHGDSRHGVLGLLGVWTGMASIDSSAPETTSDSSPTLSRRPLRGSWAATSWGRGQDSDSISSSSSDSLGSSSSSGSRRAGGGARAKSTDTSR